jgi:hypothetical protein
MRTNHASRALTLALLSGCGGGSSAQDATPSSDGPATTADAVAPDAPGDAMRPDAPAPVPDATPADAGPDAMPLVPGANRVFVSSTPVLGTFGGLAAADAICNADAAAAGLTGNFVAWLSTSTVDARDRLADGSRGWVRVDGLPVMDTVTAFLASNRMYNPINVHADGSLAQTLVWTGTNGDGTHKVGLSCNDWTSEFLDGTEGSVTASLPELTDYWENYCIGTGSFLCFELGHYEVVVPPPPPADNARIAFVSTVKRTTPGIAPLDAICAAEAASAGLPGSFLAAVPTSTASVASRFVIDSRPWRRVDGTLVAGPELLTDVDAYRSFVNQHADGVYTSELTLGGASNPTQLGTAQDTCSNWSSVSGGFYSLANTADTAGFWAAFFFVPCNFPASVLCLQE